jgi:maltose-binding protein MalE
VDYGLDIWDQETMSFHFDDERFVQALQTIKRFYDLVGVEEMADIRTNFGGGTQSPTGRFPAGQEAMIMTGYYGPGELATSAPDTEFGVMWSPVPSSRAGIRLQNVGGHPAYIPKDSANPNETFRFIEFLTSDTTAEIMFDTTGWLPGRKAFYNPESERAQKYPNLAWYLRSSLEADEFWAGPVIPIDGFVNQEKARTYDAVVYGEKTPEQAAMDMQRACTNELNNQFPTLVGN